MADLSTPEIFAALADLGVTGGEAGAKGAQTNLKRYISYCERGIRPDIRHRLLSGKLNPLSPAISRRLMLLCR